MASAPPALFIYIHAWTKGDVRVWNPLRDGIMSMQSMSPRIFTAWSSLVSSFVKTPFQPQWILCSSLNDKLCHPQAPDSWWTLCFNNPPSSFLSCLKESHLSSRLSPMSPWNIPQSHQRVICFYPSVPTALGGSITTAILIEIKIQNSICPVGKYISCKGGLYPLHRASQVTQG